MDKIKVSAVSYLNTKPLLYGIQSSEIIDRIDLSLDIPADCAKKLKSGEVDVALAPVAIIPELKEHYIISDYCIGADGPVKTVCIYSEVPLEEAEKIYLDYQSRTSVALAKILLNEYWKLNPEYMPASPGFEDKIEGKTAGVIIGDRVYKKQRHYPYIYDLSEAWKKYTGFTFVFAAWISNKTLPEDFIKAFDHAQKEGLNHIDEIAEMYQHEYFNDFDVEKYLTKNISYQLDQQKNAGLNLFLEKLTSAI